MTITSTKVSVPTALVLHSDIGALTVIRSLGKFGVTVVCADSDPDGYACHSRYCSDTLRLPDVNADELGVLDALDRYADGQSHKPVLYPLSDQYVLFVSNYRDQLADKFQFILAGDECLVRLVNKVKMFEISREHSLPVPLTRLPKSNNELRAIADELGFPCLLKTTYSHSPLKETGNYMTKVSDFAELKEKYDELSAIDPDLMIQEYISGEDDNVHIFAAYFDQMGKPKMVFTGRKLRQSPIDFGAGSICVCVENAELRQIMIDFCESIGYRGNIDVGLKWDPEQQVYKVLDINPRLGMNHRTFISADKSMDMVRAQFLDLTGKLPEELQPRLGRKWVVEDSDIRSAILYMRAGRLGFMDWLKSYKGAEEFAFFDWQDWRPWLRRYRETLSATLKRRMRGLAK
jgi:D-aspartate ligase